MFAALDLAGTNFLSARQMKSITRGQTRNAGDFLGGIDTIDMHKIVLKKAGHLSARILGQTGDLNLSLFDAAGQLIADSSQGGDAEESFNLSVAAGTYFVRVTTGSSDVQTMYSLQASLGQLDP